MDVNEHERLSNITLRYNMRDYLILHLDTNSSTGIALLVLFYISQSQ